MKAVIITEAPLAVEELVAVVGGAQVELGRRRWPGSG
jgi:hypothetical protein